MTCVQENVNFGFGRKPTLADIKKIHEQEVASAYDFFRQLSFTSSYAASPDNCEFFSDDESEDDMDFEHYDNDVADADYYGERYAFLARPRPQVVDAPISTSNLHNDVVLCPEVATVLPSSLNDRDALSYDSCGFDEKVPVSVLPDTVCDMPIQTILDSYSLLQAKKEKLGHDSLVLHTNGLELPIDSADQLIFHLRERGFGQDWINYVGYIDYLLGGGRERGRGKGKRRRRGRTRKRRAQQLVIGSELGLRNPKPMTQYPATVTDLWRFEVTLASDGSGQVSQFYALRNPLAAANGSGTYPRAPEFAKLYDEYKILSLSVLVDPHTPSISPIGRLAIAVDYDSIGSGTYTYSDLRDNQYMRDYLVTNQISYVTKDVPLTEGTYRGVSCTIHQKGWYDFNSPPEEGFVALAGEGFGASSAVAYVLLTMKVKMRRRRTINISREERLLPAPPPNSAPPVVRRKL